jgi:hypothetical protein
VPPVFSIWTAFIVFGKDDILLVLIALVSSCEFSEASRAEALKELESKRVVRAAWDARVMSMQGPSLCVVSGTDELVLGSIILLVGEIYM